MRTNYTEGEIAKFPTGLGLGPRKKDCGICIWEMKPKDAAVGFKSIFKDGGHFCPALLGVQEKRVLGSIPNDTICTLPLGQQMHLSVISGPLSSLFL